MLKRWLMKYLVNWAVEQFTFENLKLILSRSLEYFKVKAYESEMKLDEWAIEILEMIVNDDAKLRTIYDWMSRWIPTGDNGVCSTAAEPSDEQLKALGAATMRAGFDKDADVPDNCKAIPVEAWAALMRMFVPYLIEWWRSQNKQ